jgi:small-conductance mechanosensitive channel
MLDPNARIRVPFGIAYGTDGDLVEKVVLEAADEVQFTLRSQTATLAG